MNVEVTRGGLLVVLAVLGVVLYEFRTLLEFVGIHVPIVPYLAGVALLVFAIYGYVEFVGAWKEETLPTRGG